MNGWGFPKPFEIVGEGKGDRLRPTPPVREIGKGGGRIRGLPGVPPEKRTWAVRRLAHPTINYFEWYAGTGLSFLGCCIVGLGD